MGKASRAKGAAGERELAGVLRALGIDARRGQQFRGGPGSPDVVTDIRGVHIECKRVEQFRLWPALEQAVADAGQGELPVVLHRKSHRPWVAVLPLGDFVQLLREAGRVPVGE